MQQRNKIDLNFKQNLNISMSASTPVRLNYIGSKYQLLEWLTENIQRTTGWTDFTDKRIGDLFGGTGIVSYHFRGLGASVFSNDAELYSSVICHAFTRSVYNDTVAAVLEQLNLEVGEGCHSETVGNVANHYSPLGTAGRKFFTSDNARRIDYVRGRLEEWRAEVDDDSYAFLLASLLVSADAVSNVPAVYGCFLKNFKAKALKPLVLKPVHTYTTPASTGSSTSNKDVLDRGFLAGAAAARLDAVYLDPPYNERQYSKNYFPLNVIAAAPTAEHTVAGVTGIPTGCFLSPFCKRGAAVEGAFETVLAGAGGAYVFISYNSESLIPRERMCEILGKYGTVTVVERDYKRFKSFEYNEDVEIKEYLFCLRRH